MTKEELEKEAEKKYCNGCKWRIEQCLWAWRNTNGLNEPNEKNCSCKEVPAYLAGAEPREKQIQIDAEQIRALQKDKGELTDENKVLKQNLEDSEIVNKSLTDRVANLEYQLEGRDNEIKELEAQIEKMKCCYNCSKWYDGECEESPKSKTFFCADFKCDKWEIDK